MIYKFRAFEDKDENFIYHSWLKSARSSPAFQDIAANLYYMGFKKEIKRMLKRSSVFILCNPQDEAQIYTYAVIEPLNNFPCIHFIYTKEVYRKMGLAKTLLKMVAPSIETEGAACSTNTSKAIKGRHDGQKVMVIVDKFSEVKDKYKIIYSPFIRNIK